MTYFTIKVVEIIKNIPEGKVMTYGQIAQLASKVVRILHLMSKGYQLPWHRVVNAKGEITIQAEASFHEQIMFLQSEGVYVDNKGVVSLEEFQWQKKNIPKDAGMN